MSTMAEVIRTHLPTAGTTNFNKPEGGGDARYCSCGERFDVFFTELEDSQFDTTPLLATKLAEHVADALTKAGYGKIGPVLALADFWESRGEHDMAFSKTIPDEDIAVAILTDGAQKVENACHIRNAVNGHALEDS